MSPSDIVPLKIEEKILVHLHIHNPGHIDEFSAPMELAQEGIAKAIGINRTHIPRSMKRLIGKNYTKEMRRHVPGAKRKRKVYYLTAEGITAAKKIKGKLLKTEVLETKGSRFVKRTLGGIKDTLPEQVTLLEIINILEPIGLFDAEKLDAVSTGERRRIIYPEDALEPKDFYGRKKEIYRISERIRDETTRMVVITGIAGIGKTSLAMRIMEEMKEETSIFYHRFREFDTLRKMGKMFASFLIRAGRHNLADYLRSTVAYDIDTAMGITLNDFKDINVLIVLDDYHKCSERISNFVEEVFHNKDRLGDVKFLLLSRQRPQSYDRGEVVVEKTVFELELKGVSRNTSRLMLGLEEEEDRRLRNVYSITEGHPLALELVRSREGGEELKEGERDIKRYLQDEISSKLDKEEKRVLEVGSVFRRPVPPEFLLPNDAPTYEHLDSLLEKYLLVEERGGYEMHDLIREYVSSRLTPSRKRRYHGWAAEQYLEREDSEDWLEAAYHLIEAGDHRRCFEVIREKGTHIMEEEHFEGFLNILETLQERALTSEERAEILHFKGNIYIYWLMFPQAEECFKEEMEIWREKGNEERAEEAREGLKKAEEHVLL